MSTLDILSIDTKIKNNFKEEEKKIAEYEKKLYELEQTRDRNKISVSSYKNLISNIEELKEKIREISLNDNLNFYIIKTAHLLEKYKNILQTPIKISFIGRVKNNNKEKNNIITQYLDIAQLYIEGIQNTLTPESTQIICNNCSNKLFFDIIDYSIYICILCGSQQEILLHTSSYKDIDRVNITIKYTYDRKVHFRDCINQYQGKQNSTIDPEIFTQLIDQFYKHNLLVGDKYMSREIQCSKITREHIHIFLKELQYTKHYENVNLIHYQITGIKPDDISYLEDKLLDDFDILTDLYDKKFKNKPGFERKNFINTQYVLYQLLMKYKHNCKKEDFTILKTTDRKSFHDDIAKILFEDLGWNMAPIF